MILTLILWVRQNQTRNASLQCNSRSSMRLEPASVFFSSWWRSILSEKSQCSNMFKHTLPYRWKTVPTASTAHTAPTAPTAPHCRYCPHLYQPTSSHPDHCCTHDSGRIASACLKERPQKTFDDVKMRHFSENLPHFVVQVFQTVSGGPGA